MKKNLLFILSDALTASALGCYGNRMVRTPNIDRLAACGVRFTDAACVCPFCVPSRASLLTGLYPHSHGIVHNGSKMDYTGEGDYAERMIVDEDLTTDRVLAKDGYAVSFLGRFHLTDEYGPPSCYSRLYGEMGEYRDRLNEYTASHSFPSGAEIMRWYQWNLPTLPSNIMRTTPPDAPGVDGFGAEVYCEFIRKMGRLLLPHEMCFDWIVADLAEKEIRGTQGNFAVTCSFGAPHDPWAAPDPYYSMYDPSKIELPRDFNDSDPALNTKHSRQWARAIEEDGVREYIRIYYAQLSFIDAQVGRLIKALEETGNWENTLIVLTADHGDMLGRRGMIEKGGPGVVFADPLVHIPMIMCCPGKVPVGREIDAPVSQVDIMPTILDYLGFSIPDGLDGRSMRPLVEADCRTGWRAFAFAEISELKRPFDRYSSVIRRRCMIRTQDYKCVYDGEKAVLLFDRRNDPLERENVVQSASSSILEELAVHLTEAWQTKVNSIGTGKKIT